MLGVCFKSERRGWMQDQWSWVFSNFGVTDIWEIGKESTIYQTTVSIDSAAELPDIPLVILAPPEGRFVQGKESLRDFKHPDDVIYMFGETQGVLTDDDIGREVSSFVCIPTVKHECYSHAAAYMTLWDRYVKRGDFD